MTARFDDLVAGTAWLFPAPAGVVVARTVAQVQPALREVEAAVADGAWAHGFLSYEAAPGLDPSLAVRAPEDGDPPLVWFALSERPTAAPALADGESTGPWVLDRTDDEHARAVAQVRALIAAGETYQVNLTDRLRAPCADPAALHAGLVRAQRCAYGALVDTGTHVVASASPELFLEWSGRRVRTRPMKGTAARGRTTAEDDAAVAQLRASPKERAENLMIVDLLRNDLGRVAEVGGVEVTELFTAERYPTVWQLVSEVQATLRPDVGLVELLAATFPCGSVTGAPKAAAMRAIAELEASPRGVYCGAVGWLAPPGEPVSGRLSVAIRTAVVAGGQAVYGAGGGITWSSDAAAERRELRAKAAVLTAPTGGFELLETLGHTAAGGFTHLPEHLARLADSAAYCGFACDPVAVLAALEQAVAGRRSSRVRLTLDRAGRVTVTVTDPPAATGPVRLAVDTVPVDAASPWLQHKTTRRGVYTAAAARHPDADDVVLVNERGEVTETTIATLCARLDGDWWTPPTTSGCLPGTARARLLTDGALAERVLTVADLHAADELAVVSSLRGWRSAVLLPGPGVARRP
ncbi:para-aminobenzoate synthetase / 4-amino-4-deoxychorismate lyase [Klenkia marina]|uniref:Para-aminobenzoate synthetase / 4-amino-4-deoxychorismate lyase n=1 Tax=Klenkia marina TaxID=1960309 RepID=A0A1G4XFT2_9ACTN|nr:aminodeoxychorismate synthase component I [Klenkia marina]SCX39528.1 para-aminobenzoate synthetase / 4-amino-4-deoxychorismate lyase [Klenkia marina]